MKKLILAATVVSLSMAPVHAGNLSEPVVQAIEAPSEQSSSAGWIVPLILVGLVMLAISDDGLSAEEECLARGGDWAWDDIGEECFEDV